MIILALPRSLYSICICEFDLQQMCYFAFQQGDSLFLSAVFQFRKIKANYRIRDGDWIFSRGERDRFADDACAINYLLQKGKFFSPSLLHFLVACLVKDPSMNSWFLCF